MVISDCLCAIREQKDLSQGDIEQRAGPKRCYGSRVENGHTVPSMETLEKLARALEVPMSAGDAEWGSSGESAKFFNGLHQLDLRSKKELDTEKPRMYAPSPMESPRPLAS